MKLNDLKENMELRCLMESMLLKKGFKSMEIILKMMQKNLICNFLIKIELNNLLPLKTKIEF